MAYPANIRAPYDPGFGGDTAAVPTAGLPVPTARPNDWLTTTQVDVLDLDCLPVLQRTFAHDGATQTEVMARDALGRVIGRTNAEGAMTLLTRNLAGWVTQEEVESDAGFAVSTMSYDARGGRTSLTDPAGQTTTWDFDGFGDMIAEIRPGSLIPYETRTYDNFGRVEQRSMASGEVVEHVYDIGGDPVEERWLNAPTTDTEPLTTRVFDELGRITQTTYANHALAPFGVGDPTVTTTRDYDPLGRVIGESLTALGVTTQTTSSFDAGTGNWIRSATYPSGSQVYEERDQARRLARSTRISGLTADASQSSFAWLGNLPAGRAYSAADLSTTDPFTESAEYDGFGRRTAWQWDALAFVGSSPQNAGYADAYCDGSYDASRCVGPVLQIDAVRDVMGRIASLESRFGHPMTAGSPLPDSAHDTSWHGYTYTRRGYLQRDWNHLGADVVTSSVLANTDTDLAVDALANSLPTAIALDQLREPDVGSLVSIGESGEDPLWQTLAPRADGHRLTAVEVDQTTYAIAHDDAGRMTEGIDWDFGYDPNNRIASATNQVNDLNELYLYTADGDLAAVIDVRNNAQIFGYDGERMVASFDDAGTPLWEATYGDRIDQLIEYHDFTAAGPVMPLLDHRNSPVATWAPNTVTIDQLARYDAHGRLTLLDSTESVVCVEQDTGRVCDAPSGLPFAFNGRWRSPATGLVNMRARWYSPRLGEFTAPDPLGHVDLYDIRGFAAFDPNNEWDPLGLESRGFAFILVDWRLRLPLLRLGPNILRTRPPTDREKKQAAEVIPSDVDVDDLEAVEIDENASPRSPVERMLMQLAAADEPVIIFESTRLRQHEEPSGRQFRGPLPTLLNAWALLSKALTRGVHGSLLPEGDEFESMSPSERLSAVGVLPRGSRESEPFAALPPEQATIVHEVLGHVGVSAIYGAPSTHRDLPDAVFLTIEMAAVAPELLHHFPAVFTALVDGPR